MPVTDALLYLHGSGASAYGPVTSTANVISSGSQAGTVLTITTITTGQVQVGQVVGGANVLPNTVITGLGTGSGTAGTYVVNTSTTIAPQALTLSPNLIGDQFGSQGSQYSNIELDFGAPNNASTYPYLPQFPSLGERAYTFPAEVVGNGGVDFGLHILVTGYFNLLTSINFEVCTSSTTGATYNSAGNPIAARTLSLAQLQVVGAHYYIPVQSAAVLEFLRFYGAVTGTNPTAGTIVAWYGPKTGGEQ